MISYSELDTLLKDSKFSFLDHEILVTQNRVYSVMIDRPEISYHRVEIKDWYFYQTGERELTQELFYEVLLKDLAPEQIVYFMSDESDVNLKQAFKFRVSEFFEFCDAFEDQLSMEFFQFGYYVLIFPEIGKLRFFDDEGGNNEFEVDDANK